MEPIYSQTVPPCTYIRSSDFTLSDLSIFVDSMETISRIERERHERRQRRRMNKLKIKSIAEVHPTPRFTIQEDSSEAEEEEEQHQQYSKQVCPKQLRNKLFGPKTNTISPVASSDENYFSGASESSEGANNENEHDYIEIDGISPLPPTSADSGTESESGTTFKLRPRSFAMTTPKYRTTRARIIGLVLKREYANNGSQDELEKQHRRERVLEGLLSEKQKNKCESLRLPSTTKEAIRTPLPFKTEKHHQPSAEMRFIDKALRYLTL